MVAQGLPAVLDGVCTYHCGVSSPLRLPVSTSRHKCQPAAFIAVGSRLLIECSSVSTQPARSKASAQGVVAPKVNQFVWWFDDEHLAVGPGRLRGFSYLRRAGPVQSVVGDRGRPALQPVGVGEPRPNPVGWMRQIAYHCQTQAPSWFSSVPCSPRR
jgi:hypothetical protein